MLNASKDSTNPFHKSKYADLTSVREACVPALNEYGIAVLQPIVQIDGKNFVKTLLLHQSGESIESFTEIVYGKQNDAQAQGSGITYARRYGLQSLVALGAEDDDGNKATDKSKVNDKKNGFGLSPDGDLANGADMSDMLKQSNDDTVIRLIAAIKKQKDLKDLEEWLTNPAVKKEINKLEKYSKGGFDSVNSALKEFRVMNQDDSCKLNEIGN